jgi:hypothetical protein
MKVSIKTRVKKIVYYEGIKWDLKRRPIYECRCDERLKTKVEGSTRLSYTGLLGGLEHLKIETSRLLTTSLMCLILSCTKHYRLQDLEKLPERRFGCEKKPWIRCECSILYETLQVVGLTEASRTVIRLREKPMTSCECDSEKREHGVGAGVNVTMMFETLQVAGLARRSVQNGDSVEINRHEYSITTVRSRTKNTVCQRRHR